LKTIAFFNNKGGVGKTTLVYHLAWMYSELGSRVLAVDCDPQANVTSMFLDEDSLAGLFDSGNDATTIFRAIKPLLDGAGDVSPISLRDITTRLKLIPGDLALSSVEDELSGNWSDCLDGKRRAFRVLSGIWRMIEDAGTEMNAEVILVDVGPNLGALNRASMICADQVVVPLAPDLFSLQGLRSVGPTLRHWRNEWADRLERVDARWGMSLPRGQMEPIGYVVLRHLIRTDGPVRTTDRWMSRIPLTYSEAVLNLREPVVSSVDADANCLALLKNYRSLMPLAQEARKPMFLLRAADGALGGHARAVNDCYADFERLARKIASR
jgi:chromosome partitioning protein